MNPRLSSAHDLPPPPEHVECAHLQDRDQGDADREQGRGGQDSQAVKLP